MFSLVTTEELVYRDILPAQQLCIFTCEYWGTDITSDLAVSLPGSEKQKPVGLGAQ